MPVRQRDADATRATVGAWLAEHIDAGLVVDAITMPETTGFSHQTLLVDARDGRGNPAPMVVMLAPSGESVFPEPDVAREHTVLQALAGSGVPVARALGFEPDPGPLGAPFYVVERVDGAIPPDSPPYTMDGWLLASPPARQAAVWWSGLEAMASIHLLDPDVLGLAGIAGAHPGTANEVAWTRRYLSWAYGDDAPRALLDAMDWVARATPPDPERLALCWGDSRLANQVFRDGACVAVLDWEMATIADPHMDLGWWLYFDRLFSEGLGVPRLPGLPSHEDTVARYEQLTATHVEHLAFFEVLAGLRFAAILGRLMLLFARRGEYPLGPEAARDNFAITFMTRVLEEARV